MLTKQAKLKELVTQAKNRRRELEEKAKNGEEITQEERNNFEQMLVDGRALKAEVERDMELDEMDDFVNRPNERRTKEGLRAQGRRPQSWGDTVIESKQFEENNGRSMSPVAVKDIEGTTAAGGGALVQAMRDPEMVTIPMQPRSVLDMITISQTSSNSVEYAKQLARVDNAATVKDYDSGWVAKPESNLTFELKTAPVETIATYVEAHRHILNDAPQLRGLINSELSYMVRLELEQQVLNGNGTSPNFEGLLNATGVQTRTQADIADRGGEATDTKADALRRAITDIQLAFYTVDGILLNPGDGESLELQKDSNGNYLNIYDPVALRIWRVPVVESSLITAGTALVGNFRMGATLWDRQQTEIRVGEPGNMFLQNAVAILAELRAAFGVKRPNAFEKVTFV